jgi:hypothetical protein
VPHDRIQEVRLCRLCGVEAPLCNSHILAEFLYEPLYDEKHTALEVPHGGDGPIKTIQKGWRERLLCRACEVHFGRFEDHAARVLRSILPHLKSRNAEEVITEPGDYSLLKLFLLSTLWRAGVASTPTFRLANLGAVEPTIRAMLQPGREFPGPVTLFPTFAVAPAGLARFHQTIGPAGRGDLGSTPVIWLTFYGIHWFFVLGVIPDLNRVPNVAATTRGLTVEIGSRSDDEELARIGRAAGVGPTAG